MRVKMVVRLNGTDQNPWIDFGLTGNPFPVFGSMAAATSIMNNLHSVPIANEADLRERLAGCSSEFVELCCDNFVKGKMVTFVIEFPA